MKVWTYWEGKRVPYIEACLDSIRRHCYRDCEFHHVTTENMDHYIPDGVLDPFWKTIKEYGVKSDCIRAACLYLYGGLYVDADTVMLRSPVGIIDESADCACMEWSTPPRRVIAGYIYCRPGSPVAKKWLENMNAKLAQKKAGWTEIGEGCLTPAVDSNDPSKIQRLPLHTFLPIEIDKEVERFFVTGNWKDFVQEDTIAFGLNHSWMTARKPNEMRAWDCPQKELLIHGVLKEAIKASKYQPKIGVCTVTYKRPKLLGHLIDCFNRQDYENKFMIGVDDSGEVDQFLSDNVAISQHGSRFSTLGAKRNATAKLADRADILCMWDDDDLYLPWALSAIASCARRADWIRPSRFLCRFPSGSLERHATHSMGDETDKAYHVSWGMSRGLFDSVGGYPENTSLGEDLILAKRLRAANASECDPIKAGHRPYYISCPYDNEHFSWNHKDYATWPEKVKIDGDSRICPGPSDLVFGSIGSKVHPRPWQANWWKEESRE